MGLTYLFWETSSKDPVALRTGLPFNPTVLRFMRWQQSPLHLDALHSPLSHILGTQWLSETTSCIVRQPRNHFLWPRRSSSARLLGSFRNYSFSGISSVSLALLIPRPLNCGLTRHCPNPGRPS